MVAACPSDTEVGWRSGDCGIDFTIAFEDYILVLIPAASLLLVAPLRLRTIWSGTIKVITPTVLQLLKTLSGLFFIGFSFALLIACCILHDRERSPEITAAAVAFLASIAAFLLSYWEHVRSIRPSKLLQVYLGVALIVHGIHLRSTWTRQYDVRLHAIGTGRVVSCAAFLATESISKEGILITKQKRSPQDVNGIFSEGFFWWLNSLFKRGYRKILAPEDLDQIDDELSTSENDRKFRLAWLRHYHLNPKVSMVRIILSAMKWDIILPVVPKLLLSAVNFAQPYLILRFVSYLEHPAEGGGEEGVLLVVATATIYTMIATFQSWYQQSVGRFQVKLRGRLTTALHDKALRCRPDSETSALTLMNVDIERALLGLRWMHEYWSTTLSLGIALALLYTQVGIVFLAPLLLLSILIIVSIQNGASVGPKQKVWFKATQDRISYITDVIASMKNVKLLGIGPLVLQRGTALRNEEVDAQRSIRLAITLTLTISLMLFQLSTLVTYSGYAIRTHYGGPPLTTARLFASLSILKLVTTPLLMTVQSIPFFVQSIASLGRIQDYLVTRDHQEIRHIDGGTDEAGAQEIKPDSGAGGPGAAASLSNLSGGYTTGTNVVSDVSCDFSRGSLTIVVGPVGSGKSTLLKMLIGEAAVFRGHVTVMTADTAFCDQSPWLWNASVKDNICGNLDYDLSWFSHVTWACGLHADFEQLPHGIHTPVGSRGTALSGGQKNRICLARALYSRKRLIVLDDVLAGLDSQTEKLVFMRVFGAEGVFKRLGSTVILTTHAVRWAQYADTLLNIEQGKVLYQGPPALAPALCVNLSEVQSAALPDKPYEVHEGLLFSANENVEISSTLSRKDHHSDMRVYKQYLESFGSFLTAIYLLLCILFAGGSTIQSLWLKWWAAASATRDSELGKYAGAFTAITLASAAVIVLFILFAYMILLPRSSKYLHAKQWTALVKVAFHAWGSKDTGSVANRFSQDISIIDSQLSMHFINFTVTAFETFANASLLVVATPFIATTFPFVLAIFWAIQRVYLRTSKQIRILDLEAKAPLCTHFLETVTGVVTIHAFGWAQTYRERNAHLLQESQVPFYLMQSIQNWLSLVLNLVVAGLATIIMAIAVKLRTDVDAGYIGLALIQVMDLGMNCEQLVVGWTGLETSMGAIARLDEFMKDTPPEEQGKVIPPPDWLAKGKIEMDNVTASYSETAGPTLKDINLRIRPDEKVAICGRTGSGKSSLACAIFGMLHVRSGTIKVDGVDITEVSQDLLRSKMVALPQDAYFSPGTVRENLALTTLSSHSVSDAGMLEALQKVGLLEKFEQLATSSGQTWLSALDVKLVPADMLTKGQMQLFATARAMLSPGQIVLVDEATSVLDHSSEVLVQDLLRREFAGRTIVAIAHHLQTILDFDTVVVMDNGRIAEMGHPDELRRRGGSLFGELLRAAE